MWKLNGTDKIFEVQMRLNRSCKCFYQLCWLIASLGLAAELRFLDKEQWYRAGKKEHAPKTYLRCLWSWTKFQRWRFFYLICSPMFGLQPRWCCNQTPCSGCSPTYSSRTISHFHSYPSPTVEDFLSPAVLMQVHWQGLYTSEVFGSQNTFLKPKTNKKLRVVGVFHCFKYVVFKI